MSDRNIRAAFAHRRPAAGSLPILGLALCLVLVAVVPASASSSDRWFHVKVDDRSAGGAQVSVNLPLSLIEKAFELIPEDLSQEVSDEIRLELNDAGFDVEELRELWEEVRYGQDATFLTVTDDDRTLEVRKEGDYFIAETVGTAEDGTRVDVRFPLQVIDALFARDPDRLDFAAAIRALADYGDGDMVTIKDRDTTVRVWVDSQNESE